MSQPVPMPGPHAPITSPCIGICRLDADGYCEGRPAVATRSRAGYRWARKRAGACSTRCGRARHRGERWRGDRAAPAPRGATPRRSAVPAARCTRPARPRSSRARRAREHGCRHHRGAGAPFAGGGDIDWSRPYHGASGELANHVNRARPRRRGRDPGCRRRCGLQVALRETREETGIDEAPGRSVRLSRTASTRCPGTASRR